METLLGEGSPGRLEQNQGPGSIFCEGFEVKLSVVLGEAPCAQCKLKRNLSWNRSMCGTVCNKLLAALLWVFFFHLFLRKKGEMILEVGVKSKPVH